MQSVSTFGAFTTARLGMYAAQKGLDITGHNITNINTIGYTRQSLSQISLRTGGNDRYQSMFDAPVGSGVLCTGVTQLRDPYLDIRFRNEQASVGAMDSKLAGLESLSQILDEVGKGDGSGVIEKQFNDLVTQLQYLNTHGAEGEYDALVRSSASTLTQLFNSYSKKLDDVAANQTESFTQDLATVNGLLENIRDLNASIRSSEIHGDSALEQRDSRNVLIDKLSQYMKIDVTLGSDQIGEGQFVEKLTIKLAGGTSNATLVEGGFSGKLSLAPNTTNFQLDYSPLTDARGSVLTGSKVAQLGDSGLYGGLQSSREILTKKGEFSTAAELAADPKAGSKRGIPYYRNALDVLARKFATTMNGANGNNGALFSTSGTNNDTAGITAGNLSVSQGWASGATTICKSTKPNPTSGDTSNIAHIIILLDSKLPYTPGDLDGTLPNATIPYYTGSFQGALCNISATLAHDKSTTTTMLKNYAGAANELATSRDAVSGVELNDEAASLMQYQKSYSAACRLMTTIDEMLDKLINGTGIVGR